MARRPAFAKAAPSWRSSVDLPMPGSPPMSSAEPGTTPPPVTRSSSASPVGMRATLGALSANVSRVTARLLEARAKPEPGGTGTSASSLSVFHAPQAAHLPAQREAAAPQFWHTNWLLAVFTIGLGLLVRHLNDRRGCNPTSLRARCRQRLALWSGRLRLARAASLLPGICDF